MGRGNTKSKGHRQQDDVYFLLTSEGIEYGKRLVNQWDISHLAYPVGEEDDRLFRELTFDPVLALDRQTTVVYRIRSAIDLTSADTRSVLPPGGFEVIDVAYPEDGEHGQLTCRFKFGGAGLCARTLHLKSVP